MAHELHEPTFEDVTAERWEVPDWEEVADGNPQSVAGHFLLSEGGFPPDSLEDLALPVVDESGRLNRNALTDAVYGDESVKTLDVSEETEEAVSTLCKRLLTEHFESMPETPEEVEDLLLAWQQHEDDRQHDIEQKRTTDDEARYEDSKEQRIDEGPERPEKGR